MYRIGILIIILSFLNCTSKSIISKNGSVVQSRNDYAFIGKKIEIIETANRDISEIIEIDSITNDTTKLISIPMNFEYKAKYEILHNAYNRIPLDTIEFIMLDHYGRPKFEQFDNVLLYVYFDENTNKYYHEKYKFEPMRKTRNGKWKSLDGKKLNKIIREYYQ